MANLTEDERKVVINTYQLALSCSVVKIATIQKHFNLQTKQSTEEIDWPYDDIELSKKIFSFILRHSVARYGIAPKKGIPKDCPHLGDWKEIACGSSTLEKYEELLEFISNRPKTEKPHKPKHSSKNKPARGKKVNIDSNSLEARRERVRQERFNAEQRRLDDEIRWLTETRERRAKIRWSLKPTQMRKIYLDELNKKKITREKLCIKSNTSKYAIEAIENGKVFDTYVIARMLYFILTNSDIDDSKYKNQPIELFVDYIAGKTFRIHNHIPQKPKVVDNPKACNLPIYMKK